MKKFVFLIFIAINLNSYILNVVKFIDEGKLYNIVELENGKNFECKDSINYYQKAEIVCDLKLDNNITKNFNLFVLKGGTRLKIYPKYRYKIYSFTKENKFFVNILLYKNSSQIFDTKKAKGLRFSIDFPEERSYYISVLGDDLLPNIGYLDAQKLDFIKKLFLKKDFDSVVKSVDRELKRGNHFESDLILLKLRALENLVKDKYSNYKYSDIIKLSDDFLQKFPSHSNFTEVVYLKIYSLFEIGKKNKAIKLVKKLVNSFKDDIFTQKSLIKEAKYLSKNKKGRTTSYKILEKLLYKTDDINIALKTAYLLTKYSLEDKKVLRAEKFLEKILKSQPKFLEKDIKNSYKMAKMFASFKDYKNALKILKELENKLKSEEFLKNRAYWDDMAGNNDIAYSEYKEYLKKYPNGQYKEFIKERVDKVLIDIKDKNTTNKLKNIDKVLKEYKKDPIYKKALLEKVKILEEEKKYKEILKLEKKLKDINETKPLELATSKLFDQYISSDDCSNSIDIVNRYKVIVKDDKKLYKLAMCYYNMAMYKESRELSQSVIQKSSEDLAKWYYLALKSSIKAGGDNNIETLFSDFKKLVDIDESEYKDIYYDLFDWYLQKNNIQKALGIVTKIEKLFKQNVKNLDVYYKVIKKLKKDSSNSLLIEYYAKKLLDLQKSLKVSTYSPQVDLELIKALMNLGKNKEALKYFAIAYMDKKKSDVQKAELLYLAGEASLKLKKIKEAKEFFSKCGSEVKSKLWISLCSESLKLIDD